MGTKPTQLSIYYSTSLHQHISVSVDEEVKNAKPSCFYEEPKTFYFLSKSQIC